MRTDADSVISSFLFFTIDTNLLEKTGCEVSAPSEQFLDRRHGLQVPINHAMQSGVFSGFLYNNTVKYFLYHVIDKINVLVLKSL